MRGRQRQRRHKGANGMVVHRSTSAPSQLDFRLVERQLCAARRHLRVHNVAQECGAIGDKRAEHSQCTASSCSGSFTDPCCAMPADAEQRFNGSASTKTSSSSSAGASIERTDSPTPSISGASCARQGAEGSRTRLQRSRLRVSW